MKDNLFTKLSSLAVILSLMVYVPLSAAWGPSWQLQQEGSTINSSEFMQMDASVFTGSFNLQNFSAFAPVQKMNTDVEMINNESQEFMALGSTAASCLDGVVQYESVTLPYNGTGLSNCGNGNDFTSANTISCGNSSYLGGEDAAFVFTPNDSGFVEISIDGSVSWIGMKLYEGCPFTGQGGSCAGDASSSTSSKSFSAAVTAGVEYVLIVDTFASPNCIPSFDLEISAPAPPPSCPDSLGDYENITLPYSGTGLTNCGSGNTMTSDNVDFCGDSYYLNGEDKTFIFTPDTTGDYRFDLSTSTSYTSLNLFDGCPFSGSGSSCVGYAQGSTGNENMTVELTAGVTYYLIVDTWATPNCIPSFNLDIYPIIWDCVDLSANFDDSCTADNGQEGFINGDCECEAYPAPDNDEFANAMMLECGDSDSGHDITLATESNEIALCGNGSGYQDVWYTFTADGAHFYTIAETTSFDAIVSLYKEENGQYTQLGCEDFTENFTVSEAGTYYFRVRPYSAAPAVKSYAVSLTCEALPDPGDCLFTSSYGNTNAPEDNLPVTANWCNYAGEYHTVNGTTAGEVYEFSTTVSGDYLTVRSGSSDGPVVGQGSGSVSVTSPGGTLYVHIAAGEFCETQSSCRNLIITCVSCEGYDCPDHAGNIGDECTNANGDTGIIDEDCNCFVDYDCPFEEANIGDNCTTDDGEAGILNVDCGCDPLPSPCDVSIAMVCGEEHTAVLNPGSGVWTNYTGVSWDYTGSEQVFEFTAPGDGDYVFHADQGTADADFFLMDACGNNAGNLLGTTYIQGTSANNQATLTLSAGDTVYMIADLYSGASSSTTVTVSVTCPDIDPGVDCPELGLNNGDACEDAQGNAGTVEDCECVVEEEEEGCDFSSSYGNTTVPTNNVPLQASWCNWTGEYHTVNGAQAGDTYVFTTTNYDGDVDMGDYLTIRTGTAHGDVVAAGYAPLTVEGTGETLYVHISEDDSCTSGTGCRYLNITCTTCPPLDCPEQGADIGDECTNANGDAGVVDENCDCFVDYDCPDYEAFIGDDCTTDDGKAGTLNEDCGCDPLPDPCDDKIVMECGGLYTATLIPNSGQWTNYTDVSWTYNGSEQVFEFTASVAGDYEFYVDEGIYDADFFFMDGCSNTAGNILGGEVTGWGSFVTISMAAGETIYIIADLWSSGVETTVTVSVTCPEPEFDCPDEQANFGDVCMNDAGQEGTIDENCNCDVPAEGEYCDWRIRVWGNNGLGVEWTLTDGNGTVIDSSPDGGWGSKSISYLSGTYNLVEPVTFTLNADTSGDYQSVNYYLLRNGAKIEHGRARDAVIEHTKYCSDDAEAKSGMNASLSGFDFTYHPNPVKDVLYINSVKDVKEVNVYNMAGQQMLNFDRGLSVKNELDVTRLPNGVYVFRAVLEDGQVETFKVVKK